MCLLLLSNNPLLSSLCSVLLYTIHPVPKMLFMLLHQGMIVDTLQPYPKITEEINSNDRHVRIRADPGDVQPSGKVVTVGTGDQATPASSASSSSSAGASASASASSQQVRCTAPCDRRSSDLPATVRVPAVHAGSGSCCSSSCLPALNTIFIGGDW